MRFLELPHDNKVGMGESVRQKLEREFDQEIMVRCYCEVLSKLIGGDCRYAYRLSAMRVSALRIEEAEMFTPKDCVRHVPNSVTVHSPISSHQPA